MSTRERAALGMYWRCTRCGHVHDVGPVTVVQRYLDCTVWLCPGCGGQIDDRAQSWGGSAVRVDYNDLLTPDAYGMRVIDRLPHSPALDELRTSHSDGPWT